MIEMKSKLLLIISLMLLASQVVTAQKRGTAWDQPIDWMAPRFDADQKRIATGENGNDYHLERFSKLKKESAYKWEVFADRNGGVIYDEPNEKSTQVGTTVMGDLYNVYDEKGEYLEIYKGTSFSASKDDRLGWVHKSHLILWNRPLAERRTGIDIKAFIVNTDAFLKASKNKGKSLVEAKDVYQVYGAPNDVKPLEIGNLYSVLFVFKYDPINRRYLVSDHFELLVSGHLRGWVDEDRVELWQTALAIEPNYIEDAVEERRMQERFHSRVFSNAFEMTNFNNGSAADPLLIRDVVLADENLIIRESIGDTVVHVRYEGALPRFPLYSLSDAGYECGVIGKLNLGTTNYVPGATTDRIALAEKKFKKREQGLNNTNIVFVIEARKDADNYLARIEDIIRITYDSFSISERSDFKWGAVVYSDAYCEDPESAISTTLKLTDDKKFWNSMSNLNFIQTGPRDGYEASMKALEVAMTKTGMNPSENNVLIHIGSVCDRNYDMDQRECEALNPSWPRLWSEMADLSVNYLGVQIYDDGSESASNFIEYDARRIIEGASTRMYNEVREKDFLKSYEQPTPPQIIEGDRAEISIDKNGLTLMKAIWPGKTTCNGVRCLEEGLFIDEVAGHIVGSKKKAKEEQEFISKMYMDNSVLSKMADSFSGSVEKLRVDMGLTEEEWAIFSAERVQVYWRGNAPRRAPRQNHDMWKFILFISEDKVRDIQKDMTEILRARKMDVQRRKETVQSFWNTAANTILNMDDNIKDVNSLSIEDVKLRLFGLRNQGVSLGGGVLDQLTIGNINTMKPDDLNNYLDEISGKMNFWNELSGGYPYTYYPAGEGEGRKKFYWIPFEFLY